MAYLQNSSVIRKRQQPASLLAGARSVIVFGQHYQLSNSESNGCREYGVIASYALYPDYHHVLKQKARELIAHIESQVGHQIGSKFFVDSSQLMEKDYAYLAGTGWIGRNSLLIVPPYGSNCMIGCIMTDLELADDQVKLHQDLCLDCRKCIDACPTHCIQENRTIDARKCIAYLTIEYKGIIPRSLRVMMGNRLFGCDQCQIVCPLNKQLDEFNDSSISRDDLIFNGENDFSDALSLTRETYDQKFKMTPIIRASYDMFMRNVLIAIGNSRLSQFADDLKDLLEKSDSTLIRSHAAWALGMIDPMETRSYFQNLMKSEADENVKQEIAWYIH